VSDNPSSAENQQERLVEIGWVVGFVDGEGCFSINLVRQAGSETRKGYKTGYQVGHSFAVVQGARSIESLQALKTFFGVGTLCINRRRDNHKEDVYRYSVTRREDLRTIIIPFFKTYWLRTNKRLDFEKFAYCVERMSEGRHLLSEGLIEIIEVAQTMNHRKSRRDVIRILRGHTPNIRRG
jgi:LAGLIDADG DNA endonuclease family protein